MSVELYNPKSVLPSVYIPCWLIQIPTKFLSSQAKILYGRLAQWSNETGDVYRSLKQLSFELGTPERTLERHLKELRDNNLIKSFQPQAGGINHFQFLRHEWMNSPINEHLIYKNNEKIIQDPPANMRVPSRKYAGTPPANMRNINKKEIGKVKKTKQETVSVFIFSDSVSIKTHINKIINNRNIVLSPDIIEQIIFYIGEDWNYKSVNKKINIALKKIKEKKWNIPHGYKGVTSKSIREKEEDYFSHKKSLYENEGSVVRQITSAVKSDKSYKSLKEMLKNYKEEIN